MRPAHPTAGDRTNVRMGGDGSVSTHRLLYRCETASNAGGWGANPKTGAPSEGEKFRALAEEQAALGPVATLVARRHRPSRSSPRRR